MLFPLSDVALAVALSSSASGEDAQGSERPRDSGEVITDFGEMSPSVEAHPATYETKCKESRENIGRLGDEDHG